MKDKKEPDRWQQQAIELALQGKSFFVSGKAGTGKTFVLERIVEQLQKKGKSVAITAPTGVAAHNAGGRTLHSFFGLPYGKDYVYTPGTHVTSKLKGIDKGKIIRNLDVVIIDEISMVRCDVLDMLDSLLRDLKQDQRPFGGMQYIFFGDLFQLPPVATDKEKLMLAENYDLETIRLEDKRFYFFKSRMVNSVGIKIFELEGNHRQKDDGDFYNLLNDVREKKNLRSTLAKLNKRVMRLIPSDSGVTLDTHLISVNSFNKKKLGELSSRSVMYEAEYSDNYKDEKPADECLELKKNAKVMFVKNNESQNYYNGSQGIVSRLSNNKVTVRLNEGNTVEVTPEIWRQRDLVYDEKKFMLVENPNAPYFKQIPLRLSWAITIHKSQGMTFDKVVVDVSNAFAHGHVYVALSRCKTLKGLILKEPLKESNIIVDEAVVQFMKSADRLSLHGSSLTLTTASTISNVRTIISGKNKLSDTLKATLKYADSGIGINTIAVLRDLTVGTIEGHITSLIENGYLSVEDYVGAAERKKILASMRRLGDDATATDILNDCKSMVSYADIRMVRASLSVNAVKPTSSKKSSTRSKIKPIHVWPEKSSISYGIRSREFFGDKDFRIYTCEDGYYAEVAPDRFIKFGSFSKGYGMFDGRIQLKRATPGEEEYNVVHIVKEKEHKICYISENNDGSLHLEDIEGNVFDS